LKIDPIDLLPRPNQPRDRDFLDYFCPSDTWGGRLRKLRLKRNLQQKDLAGMLGLTKAAICRYEKDRSKPNKQIVSKIEEILKSDF
jgi:ribosome-binding protein aMBF1 (putative translation factor)